MDSISLEELRQINWIKNSNFISSMSEDDENIVLDRKLIIPDILDDEPLDIVYKSINFFGGEPENFLDYIRKQKQDDFNELLRERPENEHEYINKLKEFSSLDEDKLSKWAAEKGYIEILKYCKYKGYYFDEGICIFSVGHLNCLKYLHESGFKLTESALIRASLYGSFDCLKYLFERVKTSDKNLCFYASGNDLDCLKYLHIKGYSIHKFNSNLFSYSFKIFDSICSNAALNGKVDCLKYLHENGCLIDSETCNSAIECFSVPCLKYLREVDYKFDTLTFYKCLNVDSVDCLRYLHENDCIEYEDIDKINNISKSLKCLIFLHKHGYKIPDNICDDAVKNNNIETLNYFIKYVQLTTTTSSLASENGDVEILKLLHESGCPWDIETCRKAVMYDFVDCLKYAIENGCNWDKSITYSFKKDSLDCLIYLNSKGCVFDEKTCAAASSLKNLLCLQYLHKNGCPWNEDSCESAAKHGSLICLQYLHETGCPWDERTYIEIIKRNYIQCLKYAISNGCPGNKDKLLQLSKTKRVLEYLEQL